MHFQVLNFALLVLNIARASANEAYNVREWDWFGQDGAAVFATRRVSYLGHARACSTILSSRLNVSDTRVRVPDTDVKVSNTNARACLTCLSLELGARDAPRGRVDLSKATPITEENIHASARLWCVPYAPLSVLDTLTSVPDKPNIVPCIPTRTPS